MNKNEQQSGNVINFMGGVNYTVNPFKTMQIVTTSSILGEPSYYRNSRNQVNAGGIYTFLKSLNCAEDTTSFMERIIDESLSYDFKATIDWAYTLRTEYMMRLNPQVIMVRAALHEGREKFNRENPEYFRGLNEKVMKRGDDVLNQISYIIKVLNGKRGIPSILKRSWADNLNKMSRYSMVKYMNHEIGMINACRICHASKGNVPELMVTGTLKTNEKERTWEELRREGRTWTSIWKSISMGHMAMLRNLKNVAIEFEQAGDTLLLWEYLNILEGGVSDGMQFPFRYYRAYKEIKKSSLSEDTQEIICDCLERCLEQSVSSLPKISGVTVCLTDNSGSAWGCFTSELGTTAIAEINNLSSVITAMCSDEGYVVLFGDQYRVYKVDKERGIIEQANEISEPRGYDVGLATEGGIWEFLSYAMSRHKRYDNIFIYSDQQAGYGSLFGTPEQIREYRQLGYVAMRNNIDVYKMLSDYRNMVNSKVNVYSIQTAGYDNMVIPEYQYRTTLLSGWTGKEAQFASKLNTLWDELDELNKS